MPLPGNSMLVKALRLDRDRIPSFTQYPFNLPWISGMGTIETPSPVTFFVGENGSGKSTLLEAIAVHLGINPEGGSRGFNFATRESHSTLHEYIAVHKSFRRIEDMFFLRAESYFNVATEIERLDSDPQNGPRIISYYGGVSLHEQSHGESFLALFRNRLRGNGLYMFDEPEAALSPTRQLSLLKLMHDLVQLGSQFIIATHSPILMAYPHARIYTISSNGIEPVEYQDTEHYRITRGFLNSPERMLKELLADPESLFGHDAK